LDRGFGISLTVPARHSERDADLKIPGKEGHSVLEELMGDLHDARRVLTAVGHNQLSHHLQGFVIDSHDSNFGTRSHFQRRIHEAISGYARVGIDQKDYFATGQISVPSLSSLTS
jgi:hypothetical protein